MALILSDVSMQANLHMQLRILAQGRIHAELWSAQATRLTMQQAAQQSETISRGWYGIFSSRSPRLLNIIGERQWVAAGENGHE
jgi:hypothetical protein